MRSFITVCHFQVALEIGTKGASINVLQSAHLSYQGQYSFALGNEKDTGSCQRQASTRFLRW